MSRELLTTNTSFNPECEVTYDEEDNRNILYDDCEKNPGHTKFYSISEFKDHLPKGLKDHKSYIDHIQSLYDRTVRILVKYVSLQRPATYPKSTVPYPYGNRKGNKRMRRYGTGFLNFWGFERCPEEIEGRCPCPLCEESNHPKMVNWRVVVTTAAHVVFDESEAKKAVFTCFYDSEEFQDPDHKYSLFGFDLRLEDQVNSKSDRIYVECVTHNKELINQIQRRCMPDQARVNTDKCPFYQGYSGFIVSHPHGRSKQISFGDYSHFVVEKDPLIKPGKPHKLTHYTCCLLPASSKSEASSSAQCDKEPEVSKSKPHKWGLKPMPPKVNSKDPIKPGQPYMLPLGTTFTLTQVSKYFYIIKYVPLHDKDYSAAADAVHDALDLEIDKFQEANEHRRRLCFWKTFPPGTKFTLPDGEEVSFPPETLFYSDLYGLDDGLYQEGYLIYDICTCPGSSGALLNPRLWWLLSDPVTESHAGAISNNDNRSGQTHGCDTMRDAQVFQY